MSQSLSPAHVFEDGEQPAFSGFAGADRVVAPDIDRVVSLMPGFVYLFNHKTQSNDYTNRSVASYLGYSSEEIRAQGDQIMARVIHPDDLCRVGAYMGEMRKLDDAQEKIIEYRVLTKSGAVHWLRSVDRVFDRDEDGSVRRHIGCASDVTAEKEATLRLTELNATLEAQVAERTEQLAQLNRELEDRIIARTRELEQASEELEELTYVATHDLKVPINNLSRIAMFLSEHTKHLAPEITEQIGWIEECANQLNRKVSGLVLVAQLRLKSGQPSEEISLRDTLAGVLRQHRMGLRRARVKLKVSIAGRPLVRFSPQELDSILNFLIENAQQYAQPERQLHLQITAKVSDGTCHLSVKDNGSGLDMERDKQKVFGLFQRAHVSPPGSGIALHCARRMLHRRGGDISLKAARDVGAEFTIHLPMGAVDDQS